LFSQTTDLNIGFKGGIDSFNYPIQPNIDISYDQNIGFFIGGFANIYLADRLTFQPEILIRRHRRNEFFRDLAFLAPGGRPIMRFFLELRCRLPI
jgi:hypothetical protein